MVGVLTLNLNTSKYVIFWSYSRFDRHWEIQEGYYWVWLESITSKKCGAARYVWYSFAFALWISDSVAANCLESCISSMS